MDAKRFSQQVAAVTGGADGIGKAVVTRLASEGATVVILDRNTDLAAQAAAHLRDQGLSVSALAMDVADETSVRGAFAEVVARHGRLDVAVNCAAIVGPTSVKVAEVSCEEFDAVYRINLRGSFLVTKHALPHMAARNYGRILLVASIAGKEGNAGMSAYSSSKAGVIGLVKAAGKEYAETAITINALAPAVIRTAMVEAMPATQVKYMTDKIPMKRCGTLEEAAALAAWIVSPEASFNTGFTFDLTGGRAVY